MLKISLANGKTVEVDLDTYLNMTDDHWQLEMQELVAFDLGKEQTLDPFEDSVLYNHKKETPSDDNLKELGSESDLDKLNSLDTEILD